MNEASKIDRGGVFPGGEIRISTEHQSQGFVEMLNRQSCMPYYRSKMVDEILRTHKMECTREIAVLLYNAGFIEGKRAERARRKGGAAA